MTRLEMAISVSFDGAEVATRAASVERVASSASFRLLPATPVLGRASVRSTSGRCPARILAAPTGPAPGLKGGVIVGGAIHMHA